MERTDSGNTSDISLLKVCVHVVLHNNYPLPPHAAIFSRKTLSRYFAPPAADPSTGMPPQVVRQQTAVPCNGVRPTTNFLASRFPAGTNFPLNNRNWRGGGCSAYVQQQWHNDGTASVSMLEMKTKMEHSADNKKVTASKISPVRVVHPTLFSGLIHYQVIVFGSMQLPFPFDCARLGVVYRAPTRMDKNTLLSWLLYICCPSSSSPPPAPPHKFLTNCWVFTNVGLKLMPLQATTRWCELH